MMNRKTFARALVAAVCSTCICVPTASAHLKPGDKAPDFQLKGTDGKVHKLADYVGKKAVVIAWYPLAFTGG